MHSAIVHFVSRQDWTQLETSAAIAALDARVRALEEGSARGVGPMDVETVCRVLNMHRSTFYLLLPDLKRHGLVELPRLGRRRRFDAASVERVRLGRRRTRAA